MAARGVGVFVQPAGVDERLLEQVEVADGEAQPLRDGLGRDAAAAVPRRR